MKDITLCFRREWKLKSNYKKMLCIALPIFALLLTFDQLTKHFANIYLAEGESANFIPGFINFQNVHNFGAAWGIFSGSKWFLITFTFVFLIVFSYIYYKESKSGALFHVAVAFIYAGCVGNLIDRLTPGGYVRDMIQFSFWPSFPVFNVADICLCIGVLLIIIYYIIQLVKKHKRKESKDGNI